jgi:hypothetical protein
VYNNPDIVGLEVEVYRNLTKNCYSVRHKGKVISHEDEAILAATKFRVQPAGRARVLKEKRKNVHAYLKGVVVGSNTEDLLNLDLAGKNLVRVRYNPYEKDHFFEALSLKKVEFEPLMILTESGMFIPKEENNKDD